MNIQLRNSQLSAEICSLGAELFSLISLQTGIETIWQGDPAVWSARAPVLFPSIGKQVDDRYTWEGVSYEMPMHGFARGQTFEVLERQPEQAVFLLKSSQETLPMYPFEFALRITYRLTGSCLETVYQVENHGDRAMPFQLGTHTGFNAPFAPGEAYEDCYLELEFPETAPRYPLVSRLLGSPVPYLSGQRQIPLSPTLFDEGALIFANLRSRAMRLRSRKNEHGVALRFDDFGYLGIWAFPRAPYVCIEPWSGTASCQGDSGDLRLRRGLRILSPGGSARFTLSIVVF